MKDKGAARARMEAWREQEWREREKDKALTKDTFNTLFLDQIRNIGLDLGQVYLTAKRDR